MNESISIIDFANNIDKERFDNLEDKEIFKYIYDKRLLRVLFESKIFKLREIQKEAIQKGLFFRKSFLVCAPSGSGKTLIGELCLMHNVFQDFGKSIYLVPFKALATEKYFDFKKKYSRFNIKTELSIGDYEVDDKKLEDADIIITTYEKMDSILRNFNEKEWISNISTIIIDEIHIISESDRGPRLESLIVRLNELLHNPQLIGLSATIANPEFFNLWLTSLGNQTFLIKSDKRPVPLHYKIEITQNKDSTIKKILKNILKENGSMLIFLNKRKSTQSTAVTLQRLVKSFLDESELKDCNEMANKISQINGYNKDLYKCFSKGIAFHHAGLLRKERKIIEDSFRNKLIKVICCTTTLSAGINVPARAVIIKDFKKYVTSGNNIKDFSGFYEFGDGFSYFKPFSSNEIFQMLGRAGRPGLDIIGHGILLAKNIEESTWIEDNYFSRMDSKGNYIPKYNELISGLNKINTLKEQVLLRIFEETNITIEQIKKFFKKTYFWYCIKDKMMDKKIPIDQFLLIKEISPKNILKLHSDTSKVSKLKKKKVQIKISKIDSSNITGYIKTDYGVYSSQFDIDIGIRCSCGFENVISDNYIEDKFVFEFCDHITLFLLHLIQIPDITIKKYVLDIIPKAVKNQYILNYLFEKGLIIKNEDDTIKCSQFGKLIIRLYLYPVSGVLIRNKLEYNEISDFHSLIKEAYEILKTEHKVRDDKMLGPILDWIDEVPIDDILERDKIMAGDLHSVKDNLERIIKFIGIIAGHLSDSGYDLQNDLIKISEMSETLNLRLHYGIKEELFDLVLRIDNVARVRARILYEAGFHTATQVKKSDPYLLSNKTKFGIDFSKKLIRNLNKKKK